MGTTRRMFRTEGVIPREYDLAEVWVEGSTLCIQMTMDNVFDVKFVRGSVLRPRVVTGIDAMKVLKEGE